MTSLIGASLIRPDAYAKVTGAAHYPSDLVTPDMLRLRVVFAKHTHAKIMSIDTTAAWAVPGIVAVLLAADVPSNAFGLIEADQPLLCDTVVRFSGDRVALVVAETQAAADTAAKLVQVVYADLPAVTDAYAAMAADAPLVHANRESNILSRCDIRKGNVAQALIEADVVIEGEFGTTWQDHAFLQPEAGIAFYDQQNRLVIETAGQWLHEDRRQIAALLQLPEEQVVVRYAAIGGAFGGREDLTIQPLVALATFHTKRPCAMIWSREESLIGHHKRHPITYRCTWAATRDGRITAVRAEVVADGGAYASTSAEVLKCATLFASGCYEIDNIESTGYAVYTNNIPSGAFRGFGAPQAHLASESMVTRLAHTLGMDPVEIRRINLYQEGSIEPTQHPLPVGVTVRECLEAVVADMMARRNGASPPNDDLLPVVRGWGVACGIKNLGYSFGFPEQATATIELIGTAEIDQAIVRIGAADVGQGTHLILRQIAAETLGVAFDRIRMITNDSSEAPNAGSASASRLTIMAGRAVLDASKAALAEWQREERPASATVQYRPPRTTPLDPQTTAGIPNYAYAYAAQAVEVEVDTTTGAVRVLQLLSAHDVGRAINRQQVEGQIIGGLAQGLGYVLTEQFQIRDGQVRTPGFSSYLLPTVLDMPTEIVPIILELGDHNGPYGARGMAELPLVPLAAAIACAIHDATGVWVTQQPFTPERVLEALQSLQLSAVSRQLSRAVEGL
ncbi:MAG: xanthine dehydrogenase family protein molybdopterin-binding subunit [Roseiflexaceae bacterium]|nr:xanthine dehydrogenase family protein molybdopterin-binding subunit [Roseiflexaceae bacterium]